MTNGTNNEHLSCFNSIKIVRQLAGYTFQWRMPWDGSKNDYGWAQVLSDDLFCTWVFRTGIRNEKQNTSVEKELFNAIHERFHHTAVWWGVLSSRVGYAVQNGFNPKSKLISCRRPASVPAYVHERIISKPFNEREAKLMSLQNCELTSDVSQIDLASLGLLYESVGFGTQENYAHPGVSMDKLFGPGVFGFFALHNGELIGLARVLSDDCMCSWIAELCVKPNWQGKGVGHSLLDLVLQRFSHTPLYADAFKGQEAFFEAAGIRPQSKVVACGRAPLKIDG